MKNNKKENAKVGLFVLAGILFLVLSLYLIGKNQDLFGSTFTLKAVVNNVSGLVQGNNVRFRGMDVGTVKSIDIANDTAIYITMVINKKMKPYIKKNTLTSIGTDGLMGNKLIQINPQQGDSEPVNDGDFILSQISVESDDLMRSLDKTTQYVEKVSLNLYEITTKLNNNNSLWSLLSDTVLTRDLKNAVAEFHRAGANSSELTQAGKNLLLKLDQGNGMVDKVFTDTTLSQQLESSIDQILQTTNSASEMMEEIKKIVESIGQGDGPAGVFVSDTLLRRRILNTSLNLEEGTYNFNQNMEALKANFLFRGYFRRLEKKKSREGEKSPE